MGAGVLFVNEENQVLLVEPAYKKDWEIPGGIVESDESPLRAVVREVREELGLEISPDKLSLAGLDYMAANGDITEALMFVFWGGVLDRHQKESIAIDGDELKSYRFVDRSEISDLLSRPVADRVIRCLDAIASGKVSYAERQY